MAEEMNVPFLGSIPIDPNICLDSDEGVPFIMENPESPAAKAFSEIAGRIEELLGLSRVEAQTEEAS